MNLKHTNILLVAIGLLLSQTSCRKSFLDTKLDTQPTPENLYQDYKNLIKLANAPYAYLQNYNEFQILDNNLMAPVTDEAVQTNNFGSVYDFNDGTWNQFNNPNDYFNYYYAGIFTTNYFFEFLGKIGDYKKFLALNRDTITTASKNEYHNDVQKMKWSIAEAHVLRAYYHFELAKRYGRIPLVKQTYAAGEKSSLSQASFEEAVSFIVSEIDQYKNDLQPNWKTSGFTTDDGKFSKGSALALKARVLLYAASPLHNPSNDISKWQAAAAAANEAVAFAQRTDKDGGQNSLDANYRNYFLGNNTLTSSETILAVRYFPSSTLEQLNYPVATPGGNTGITPTQNLVDAYEYTGTPDPNNPYANRDPRLGYTVVTNGSTWNGRTIDQSPGGADAMTRTNASKTGYYLKKFLNDNVDLINNSTNPRNWPVYRYGELLLEYSEAMNEAYGPDNSNGYSVTARGALNLVRARPGVGMPPVTIAGKDAFRNAVKRERQVELAFEDHRYWDLLRWNDAAVVQNQPVNGVIITKNNGGQFLYAPKVVQKRVFSGPKMYYFPFPQSEISISNGSLVQNPGW